MSTFTVIGMTLLVLFFGTMIHGDSRQAGH
jgi:hypothetical protein